MIRTIVIGCYVVLFLTLSAPLMLIEWLIGKKDPLKSMRQSSAIVGWALRCIRVLSGMKLTASGLENVPSDRACLFVGNHRSYFDIVAVHSCVPVPIGYVAKSEFLKAPLLRHWMVLINCLFLDRSAPRKGLQMVLDGVQNLRDGKNIFIFPEGTRTSGNQMLPFKEGSIKMAVKAKAPIIPVAITGTREVFESHRPFVRSSRITVTYGAPIYPDQMNREETKFLGALVQERIQTMLDNSPTILSS